MAKNTYKQNSTPPARGNEPRPSRNPAQPAAEPAREPRRNEAPQRPTAAKTTAKVPKEPRRPLKLPAVSFTGFFGFLRDRRFQLFLGFFFLLSSIYLTIAFVSFVFTGHSDQSVVEGLSNTQVKEAGQESGNWLGLIGALLAQVLIYKGFGVAAFAVIPIVFFLGYKIVFRRPGLSLSYVLALCLFSMVWLSLLLGYIVLTLEAPDSDPVLAHSLDFLSGGIGYETALWLDSLIGWGTVLLLAFLLISFVVFFFNVTSLNLSRSGDEEEEPSEEQSLYEHTGLGVNHAADPTASLEEQEQEAAPLGMTLRRVGPVVAASVPAIRPQ
ncbi:MAG TPA: DNA translocase FtsK 4TM domain-containing protein, partial [Hymenobacter sp.]